MAYNDKYASKKFNCRKSAKIKRAEPETVFIAMESEFRPSKILEHNHEPGG